MMKVVCISDTHSLHHRCLPIPEGDVLVHAGDITRKGDLVDVENFNIWLGSLPHKHKIVIAGNHDFCFERSPKEARSMITNAIYLEDEEVVIDTVKFYGSPWQPWFFNWAFNLKRGEPLKKTWDKIPDDTDVLITHGPPHGYLDMVCNGERVGCEELLKRLAALKNLKLHVFGHIHEAYGVETLGEIRLVNASSCDLGYTSMQKPIVVDL